MSWRTSFRDFWANFRAEVLFGLGLVVLVVVSTYLSYFIPEHVFDNFLTPFLNVFTVAVAINGAWIIFRHTEGMRVRRIWGYVLLGWAIGDLTYILCSIFTPVRFMNMGADQLTVHELIIGNILGWLMVLYPTEALRPGWLSPKIVAWQLLPMLSLGVLDYFLPISLWIVLALYPLVLLIITLTNIRAYIVWCENNYSSMENIDVQWIIRYCIMLAILGANFVYMCTFHAHARAFTQEWFVIVMLIYSTEQILYRKDPWDGVLTAAENSEFSSDIDYSQLLQQWMESEKPYLDPNFKLIDLRAVLPMNRTYLSQFINDTYGCSFYQFVNRYRIEEAKRLLSENPEMKIEDIATQCGFASRSVFTRTFTQETDLSPREWSKQNSVMKPDLI